MLHIPPPWVGDEVQWGELGFLGQIIEPFCVLKGFVAAPA